MFGFRKNATGEAVRKTQCVRCLNEYHVERRRRDPEVHTRHLDQVKAQKVKLAEFVADLKRGPCTDCGRTYNPWQMQFDHVRGEKIGDVAFLVGRGSRQRVLEEIKKCELVCANCHADRTHARLTDA